MAQKRGTVGVPHVVFRILSCLLLQLNLEHLNARNYQGNALCNPTSFFVREHSAVAILLQKLCWPLERRQASFGPISYRQPQRLLQRLLRLRVRVWLGVDPGHVSEPQKQGHAKAQVHPALHRRADQRKHSELGRLQTLARQDESAAVGEYPLAHHVQFSRARPRLQRLRARQLYRVRSADFPGAGNMQENRVHERARPRLHGLHKCLVATWAYYAPSRQWRGLVWVWEHPWCCIHWRQLWVLQGNKPKLPLLQLRWFHHEPLVWEPRGLKFHKWRRRTVRGGVPDTHALKPLINSVRIGFWNVRQKNAPIINNFELDCRRSKARSLPGIYVKFDC